jgi:tetratricopeptide (TPR) repeat protein
LEKRKKYQVVLIGLIVAAGVLAGCAGRQTRTIDRWPDDVPLQSAVGGVPFFPQEAYQCGPSSLAMTLNWSGVSVTPDQIASRVFTPSLKGSLQPAMIAGARRSGRLAYVIRGNEALHREIAAGHPAIVLQNLGLSWYPVWHYAVVIGYDAPAGEILLHSGADANKRMPMALFRKTWARGRNWGLLVMPPHRLPATANEHDYTQAALGLEKAGQFEAAATAFRTARNRWPRNFVALMGEGNNLYALGELNRAAMVFKEATRLHPMAADAHNNLAQVLFELGRLRAAEKAARAAVELGGPNKQIYLQTLNQIETGGKNR